MATRRHFIAAGTALAASTGIAAAATPAPKPSPTEEPLPKLKFDLSTFNELLDRDVAHKHLFSARIYDAGGVFDAVRATLNAYDDIGVSASAVAPVVVLYHTASVLGFDDYAWKTYIYKALIEMRKTHPEDQKQIDDLLQVKGDNPALVKEKAPWDTSIPSLINDAGLRIFVCNNALSAFSQAIAKQMKKPATAVYADLSSHLVPNAMVVPAGVWAVHAIQEHKYTLLKTS